MLIGDKIIYLELQKTACTHTEKLLESLPGTHWVKKGKHNQLEKLKKHQPELVSNFADKIKVGNVRNPWDWYVSLWSFGCQKEGGFYRRLTGKEGGQGLIKCLKKTFRQLSIPQKKWEQLYNDRNNFDNFRKWLGMINSSKRKNDFGEGFGKLPLSDFAGLFTFRYLKLYTYNFDKKAGEIKNYQALEDFDRKNNFIDFIIKQEGLNEGIERLIKKYDLLTGDFDEFFEKNNKKTNTSKRDSYYRKYYDEETKNLVKSRDKLIIDKYGYQF